MRLPIAVRRHVTQETNRAAFIETIRDTTLDVEFDQVLATALTIPHVGCDSAAELATKLVAFCVGGHIGTNGTAPKLPKRKRARC